MNPLISYILITAIMPVLFFLIALSPVEVFGCRTRGLLALLIAFASGIAALVTTIKGARERAQVDSNARWWMISTLVLVIPVIAMIVMA